MGEIKNAVTTAKRNIKDWWSDDDHQAMVGAMGTAVIGCLGCFALGRIYGQIESDKKCTPEIIKLMCISGELAGENTLLREMLDTTSKEEE